MNYPVPRNEIQRLNALRTLMVLDTPRDIGLDALVELARDIFDVPISVITLVDCDRQSFKAVAGLDICQSDRETEFCNYTISGSAPFIVNDASQDERFCKNPLVVAGPQIRFYAGVPLALSPGINLGSLCIIDRQPGTIDEAGVQRLIWLGDIVVSLLRQDRVANELAALSDDVARQADLISFQTKTLDRQKNILDRASTLAKLGAWELDLHSGKLAWSDGIYALHGVDRTFDFQSENFLDFYPQPDRDRLVALIEKSRRDNNPYKFEGRMFTAKGCLRWVRIVGDVEIQEGQPVRRFGLWQDITDEKAMVDRIHSFSQRDDLTGLFNRKALRDKLGEIAGADLSSQKSVALFYFDIDNFKDVNDTHGHAAGDACLRHVGRRIRAAVGDCYIVARIGGDEFAVLTNGTSLPESLDSVADLIRSTVAIPVRWRGHAFQLTASVGVAVRGDKNEFQPDELVREAELALYEAKAAGRNCHKTFRPALQTANRERFETVRDVRRALALHHLELYYQPKVSLADGGHQGFEALLRWNKSAQSVVAPGAFLAALEDPNLSKEIGDFVIAAAINQAMLWKQASIPFGHIAVNLSASQFRDPSLAANLLAEIASHGIDPSMIEVEVTEGVFLSTASDMVLRACESFKAGGIRIAFDDFGTGFASLSHLRDFPVDIIKIDRSFISQLNRGQHTTAIVNAMVGLAHNLSMEIVAEGVELEAQAIFLRAIGCNQAQGYLFGRPVQAPAAIRNLVMPNAWSGSRVAKK